MENGQLKGYYDESGELVSLNQEEFDQLERDAENIGITELAAFLEAAMAENWIEVREIDDDYISSDSLFGDFKKIAVAVLEKKRVEEELPQKIKEFWEQGEKIMMYNFPKETVYREIEGSDVNRWDDKEMVLKFDAHMGDDVFLFIKYQNVNELYPIDRFGNPISWRSFHEQMQDIIAYSFEVKRFYEASFFSSEMQSFRHSIINVLKKIDRKWIDLRAAISDEPELYQKMAGVKMLMLGADEDQDLNSFIEGAIDELKRDEDSLQNQYKFYSALGKGRGAEEEIDLKQFLNAVLADSKFQSVQCEELVDNYLVKYKKAILELIVKDIIRNAEKYGLASGGTYVCSISSVGSYWEISFENQCDPSRILSEQEFDALGFRSLRSHKKGTGTGLRLAQEMMDKLGGAINFGAYNSYKNGTFTVVLKLLKFVEQ